MRDQQHSNENHREAPATARLRPRAGRPAAHRVTGAVIVAVICGGLAVAGCTSSASSTASTANTSAGAGMAPGANGQHAPAAAAQNAQASAAQNAPAAGMPSPAPSAPTSGAGAAQRMTTTVRVTSSDIVYTAELTVRVADVNASAAQAAQIADASGGYVSNESTSSGTGAVADITLKIPVSAYPATLARLATGLGTQKSLNQQAQDVTAQVTDVNSQVASDQAAIGQLRALLSHAGSVGDLLTVQNQINSEESGLEQLEAQQRELAHETAYATVIMTIEGPKAKPLPPAKHKPKPPPSLTRGLGAGWHGLRVTTSWVLAVLGAVAPFGAIAAVVAIAWLRGRKWVLRRRAAEPAR
jgi:Domain of unknown function (DUF4349)